MAVVRLKDAFVSYYVRAKGGAGGGGRSAVGAQILKRSRYYELSALRGINLELCDGDRVGLVGTNGSGKSTLLKVCAGALLPRSGIVHIEGRISPQFGLGSGMRPALTGRQNAELKCLYLGVSQTEIHRSVEEIKLLSGLGDYFELPIQTYSAGMKSRLVMSLLKLVRGDVLLMDEWINAADPSLNTTVGNLQEELIRRSKILLLASHSKRVLEEWVDKIVWLDRGEVKAIGRVEEVYPDYQKWIKSKASR
ncbi:ATP-binding cassette domain-containing protein [Nitratireductor aquimarinus]|uniref:ABC transporter ATP-binding protein n=1 Tax=Nitratireductor aquimarinus TaxID=889300 RepID=UPI0029358DB2|nr:ATP-binding cassette domain-containing protein [Nitratireductor aquimarinus]MDV2968878.1 ATP-binding cassette domain-containing protein [Nitratireductor aquimarinus]